ncbi:hypothetical protein Pyn_13747 [Prunus yedoensis var. nudiflora]|uniref:Uncharacterized protein n=1 Tax=Prunus yedoensis var. nudiflora TaxID=2094558 RepID=A0A314YA36_PRUYE|nr:hypothetical protein Pyn_13747 [Prunus yedoensis var. nudiflora]
MSGISSVTKTRSTQPELGQIELRLPDSGRQQEGQGSAFKEQHYRNEENPCVLQGRAPNGNKLTGSCHEYRSKHLNMHPLRQPLIRRGGDNAGRRMGCMPGIQEAKP